MKNFEYIQAKTLEEASQLLGKGWEEALPYAGGSDLYGMIKHQLVSPGKLVNLKSIPNLDRIAYTPAKGLKLGPLVKISDIADNEVIRNKYTVLAQAAAEVASPQLRNMGTIGGNLCQRPRCWYYRGEFHCLRKGGDICYAVDGENKYHCIIGGGPCFIVHPSDTAVALSALDAQLTIRNGKKSRQIALKDFFVLPEQNVLRENILNPGEIVEEIFVPEPAAGSRSGYLKMKERGAWDFAIVSVAAVVNRSGNQILSANIALGGVAPIPWLENNVSNRLKNAQITAENIALAAQETLKDAYPLKQNSYKLILARNLTRKILTNLTAA
jgi:xanthine dehydrogenase YagS FAD-binding subunit